MYYISIDISGKGIATYDSMIESIKIAAQLAAKKMATRPKL